DIAEAKEQLPDLSQRKAELARTSNDCQPIKHSGIVTPLPTHSLRGRKQPDLLVVANRRWLKSKLPCDLRNCQQRHNTVQGRALNCLLDYRNILTILLT